VAEQGGAEGAETEAVEAEAAEVVGQGPEAARGADDGAPDAADDGGGSGCAGSCDAEVAGGCSSGAL